MPFYEYQCQDCGEQLEVLQKMSDAPLSLCPACAKPALQKKISAVGFRLKGGGWYETDFKNSNRRNLAQAASEAGKGETKKADKSDKPADKTPKANTH